MSTRSEGKEAPIRADLVRIVRERIVNGELAPGSRILESRLAQELGASRTPLREALINLEQEGFVRSELARGFSVEPLSGREVRETYPILWTLESLALRASGNAVYALIGELSRLNAALADSTEAEESLNLDTRWHEKLLSRCPNRRLNGIISGLRTAVRRYEQIYMDDANLVIDSVRQHQQIIEALEARNIEGAERALVENWSYGMSLLLVGLGEP